MSILSTCLPVDNHADLQATRNARAFLYGAAIGRHDEAPVPQVDYDAGELESFLDGWQYAIKAIGRGESVRDYIADDLATKYTGQVGDAAIPDDFSRAIPNDNWYDYEAMFADEMENSRRIIDEEWEGKRLRRARWHESEVIRAIGERAYAKGCA